MQVTSLKSSDGKKIVYIKNEDLKTARAAANAKIFARNLLEGILSDEALYKCTVAGGEFRAAGKGTIVRKPQIDPDAITVILGKFAENLFLLLSTNLLQIIATDSIFKISLFCRCCNCSSENQGVEAHTR